jgi:hypothetical protein
MFVLASKSPLGFGPSRFPSHEFIMTKEGA